MEIPAGNRNVLAGPLGDDFVVREQRRVGASTLYVGSLQRQHRREPVRFETHHLATASGRRARI